MNRKQRRAALKQSPSAGGQRAGPAGDPASQLFAEAEQLQRQNKLDDAARAYKRLLLLKPDHAEASNNLGLVLLAQGKRSEASACFAQSLTLMPQLFEQFNGVCQTLAAVLPPIGEAMRRALAAWPNRLAADQLLGGAGRAAICDDPLLLCMLQSVPARNTGLERVLTALRAALLADVGKAEGGDALAFRCALARQCFINEYVFATTPDEDAQVERLKATLADAHRIRRRHCYRLRLAALAMYRPLYSLPDAEALLDRAWPAAVDDVVTQQLREPLQELALRPSIRAPDADRRRRLAARSAAIRRKPLPALGERSPAASRRSSLDRHLRNKFPTAAFTPLGKIETRSIFWSPAAAPAWPPPDRADIHGRTACWRSISA